MTDVTLPRRIQRRRTKGWRKNDPELLRAALVDELAGRDLVCYCPLTAVCHADVLIEFAAEVQR